MSSLGALSSLGSGAAQTDAGASTYGAGWPSGRTGAKPAAGETKRPRAPSHSETATTTNAAAIRATTTAARKCATPAITATAMISAASKASLKTTTGTSRGGAS